MSFRKALIMCGGFTITADKSKIIKHYGVKGFDGNFLPRYNARPFQRLPILAQGDDNKLEMAMWQFVFPWGEGKKTINIRSESLSKPFYRKSFTENRCLVPVDGFYEWEKVGKEKIPHKYSIEGGNIFSLGGLCQESDNGLNFAIITVPANKVVGEIHDRMPFIVSKNDESSWLKTGDVEIIPYKGFLDDVKVTQRLNVASFDEPY